MKKTTKLMILAASLSLGVAATNSFAGGPEPVPAAAPTGLFAPPAQHWLVRVRGLAVVPQESSKTITIIGGKVSHISTQIIPELDISYFFTQHLALELILATSSHSVFVKNTALSPTTPMTIGKVRLLPPVLTAQYHFFPETSMIRPYVGVGINYTHFFDVRKGAGLAKVTYGDSIGPALQAGVDVAINKMFVVNADIKKVFIHSRVAVTKGLTTVRTTAYINPWIFGLGVGIKLG